MVSTWTPPLNRRQLLQPVRDIKYRKNEDPGFVHNRFTTAVARVNKNN